MMAQSSLLHPLLARMVLSVPFISSSVLNFLVSSPMFLYIRRPNDALFARSIAISPDHFSVFSANQPVMPRDKSNPPIFETTAACESTSRPSSAFAFLASPLNRFLIVLTESRIPPRVKPSACAFARIIAWSLVAVSTLVPSMALVIRLRRPPTAEENTLDEATPFRPAIELNIRATNLASSSISFLRFPPVTARL